MARTKSLFGKPLTGNLGTNTFKNYSGEQVVTSRVYETTTRGEGATKEQRMTRLRLPMLTLLASRVKDYLPHFFETNRYHRRAYTHFLSHNLTRTIPVHPKAIVEGKVSLIGYEMISCGSLPAIEYTNEPNGGAMTNILFGSSSFSSTSSWSDTSKAILSNNRDFKEGDIIFFARFATEYRMNWQDTSYYDSVPKFSWLQINTTDSRTIAQAMQGEKQGGYFGSQWIVNRYFLKWSVGDYDSVAIIHIRKQGCHYLSSTQYMVGGQDWRSLVAKETTDLWYESVAYSWGYSK